MCYNLVISQISIFTFLNPIAFSISKLSLGIRLCSIDIGAV